MTWESKGGYDLRLGVKGFFTTIFYHIKDKNHVFVGGLVFVGGPYFFHSASLYLTLWQERLTPKKADLLVAPVWLPTYSLPCELLRQEILEDIGNALETFMKIVEQTKRMRYVSYARICVI